jgi:polyisoprenoid-binding protein YceI
VTRPVTLAVEFAGAGSDPWGNTKAGFSASTEIDREDFGLTWNQALETGGVLVGKQVRIEIEVQAVQG